MEKIFETVIYNRKVLLKFLDELSFEQLTFIPKNFKNSIFWNIAHTLVTQQIISYELSGLDTNINKEMVAKYRKGTIGTTEVSMEEIELVKQNLISLINKTKEDYKKGIFTNFQSYLTSTGITLNNIDEAIFFNAFHEGIHLGVILAIKKIV